MKRLTTDHPENSFETALNFVYGKGGVAYFRTDWDRDGVPVHEWAKTQCILRGCDEFPGETLEEIDEIICNCPPDCPVHLAYTFACQAVHLRGRLKRYEDTGLMPDDVERLAAQEPNNPLTLEELREVSEDNPILVWVVCVDEDRAIGNDGEWQMFDGHCFINRSTEDYLENYGTKFLAYRRKPEETS